MNKNIVVVLTGSLLLCNVVAHSATSEKESAAEQIRNPLGCRDVGYQFNLNVLQLTPEPTEDHQFLFFVRNSVNQPVHLHQMMGQDSTRSVALNNVIKPGEWAALATNQSNLKFICSVEDNKSKYGSIVNCADAIKVCEYARVKFGMNNRGNYWIVNSTSRGGAVSQVLHYGIIPR